MADQNTPAGGRPGRPFIPPFRGPSNADGAGAGGERTATPERTQPRPFMPPGSLGPGAPAAPAPPIAPARLTPPEPPVPPVHPPLPTPPRPPAVAASEPVAPESEPAVAAPVAPRPKSPVRAEAVLSSELGEGSRDLAHELAEELAEELAVEHAISETIGQGGPAGATESLELERASEELPNALPELPRLSEPADIPDEDVPSGGPELSFFLPPDETDSSPPDAQSWPAAQGASAAEDELPFARQVAPIPEADGTDEADRTADDRYEEEAPSSSTPLPWLAAPTQPVQPTDVPVPLAPDEMAVPGDEQATRYDEQAKPRDTPARRLGEVARDETATIVGANVLVAETLERVAHRVRSGELRVPSVDESAGEAGALASVLAVLLGVRS